jgi:hypothetical protein
MVKTFFRDKFISIAFQNKKNPVGTKFLIKIFFYFNCNQNVKIQLHLKQSFNIKFDYFHM